MADKSGYIGNNPGDTSVVVAREVHEPTGIQTTFTFTTGYKVGYIDVYVNGSKLVSNGTDYTATDGNTVGLTTYAQSGDIIELVAYKAFNAATIENAPGNLLVGNNLTVTGITTFNNDVYTSADLSLGGSVIGDGSLLTGIAVTDVVHTREITCSGVATFAGSISVGGTITHEDVTNVDSVGIVTAGLGLRATAGGLQITAGIATLLSGVDLNLIGATAGVTSCLWDSSENRLEFVDNAKASFGTGNDLEIYHDGSTNVVDSASANLEIRHGAEKMIACAQDGQVELWYDSGKKIETTTAGGQVTGILTATSFDGDSGVVKFTTNGTETARIDASGNLGIGTDSPTAFVSLLKSGGNAKLQLQRANAASNTDDYGAVLWRSVQSTAVGSINVARQTAEDDGYMFFQTANGGTMAERARITKTGGISLDNGELIERCYINATAWSTNGDINLDNGMVQYNTANLAGTTNTLNITSSVGINTQMATGDVISVTCISSQNANTAYVNNITVDHAAVTENWIGGSAPTDGGGSGVDLYAFSIIKTASATYTVIANQNKTS